jgi:hypothetical protein
MQMPPVKTERSSFGLWRFLSLFILCALCCQMNWLKLNQLDLDPVRWLSEGGRAAAGEFPYIDFSWQFPPFALGLVGGLFHLFGSTFLVAQVLMDVLGAIAVMLFLSVARVICRDSITWALTLLFIAVGEMGTTLFTLKLYSPAALTGIIGTLLMLLASARLLQKPVFHAGMYAMFCAGSFICLLSKPEFVFGCVGIWLGLAAGDRMIFTSRSRTDWFLRQGGLALSMSVPAAAVYLWIGMRTGRENLWQGFSGYGGAAHSCPWWPTGFGFFYVLGGLGEGTLLLGMLALCGAQPWTRHRRLFAFLAIPSAAAAIFQIWLVRGDILFYVAQPLWYRILHYIISPQTILFPFVCLGFVALPVAIAGLIKLHRAGRPMDPHYATLLVLLSCAAMLSIRSLFGTLEGPVPLISVASQPFWILLAPALLCPLMLCPLLSPQAPAPARSVKWIAGTLFAYAAILLLGYLPAELKRPYSTLQTRAGAVRLGQFEPDASVYRFLVQAEQPGEGLIDLPYGGGFNFAARLKSPLFTTQHILLPVPFHYLEDDLKRAENHPPGLAVVAARPRFGTSYGGHQGCSFPAITWKPRGGDSLPGYVYPIADFLEKNYSVAAQFGGRLILKWRGSPDSR